MVFGFTVPVVFRDIVIAPLFLIFCCVHMLLYFVYEMN